MAILYASTLHYMKQSTIVFVIYIKKNLYNGNLSKGDLFKLLETEIRKSFIFDYLFYKQVDGATMSSPLRPNLVNTFLRHYEKEWFNNCPIHFRAMTYKRYVDNIFVPFSSKDHL